MYSNSSTLRYENMQISFAFKIFNESVLMYSEGPATQIGGNIGWIYRNKLRKDFAKPLKFAKKGDIVGPVKAKEAYYFLRINNMCHTVTY